MSEPAPDNTNSSARRPDLSLDEYAEGVLAGDRALLGRAITLIESNRERDFAFAEELLTRVMPQTGGGCRVGITGVPGVGKSTFIDTLGTYLTDAGHRVAVLAVDPSSGVSGGSILGDKTRMPRLGVDGNAFIRPSPSAGMLGGVARKTRETMLICEAAGFDVILVETVGVGQSETVVAEMTDFFLALMLPGAGDELQGIKRGLLELADMLVINKADGDNEPAAKRAAREYANALHFTRPADPAWLPPVKTCSAKENTGIDEVWQTIADRHADLRKLGRLDEKRRQQRLGWLHSLIDEQLRLTLAANSAVKAVRQGIEADVLEGRIPAATGARGILEAFTQ